jgi:hypothetical protein
VVPSTTNIDARRDLTRELMQAGDLQLSAAASLLEQVAETGSATPTGRAPTAQEIKNGLMKLQRDAGLAATGHFDAPTMVLMQRLGFVHRADAATPATPATPQAPTAPSARPTQTTSPTATPATPPTSSTSTSTSTSSTAVRIRDTMDAGLRAGGFALTSRAAPPARGAPTPSSPSGAIDRALDPARLLASLVAAGVGGHGAAEAVSAFQALVGLPVTGHVDEATHKALIDTALVPASSGTTAPSSSTASASSPTTPAADTVKAATLTQAASARTAYANSTTVGTGASSSASMKRAPPSAAEAREQARLQTLLAQAAAVERGVQANRGAPVAVVGHGQQPGTATGLTGSGGQAGGVDAAGTEAALVVDDREQGKESSTGNQHSGDDDHDNTDRGDAVDAVEHDEHDDDRATGYHRVPSLAAQVTVALGTIARLDDDTVPVHYAWDVTLYRPGVYSDGQTAEPLWHLVVERAHAFDAVWARAVEAVATRLALIEPDATPLTLPDVIAALRQARVR